MTSILPNGKQYYPKPDGTPAVGWKVQTFDTNTSNPRATYSDINGSFPNTNPVILDARGEAKIFWNGNYRVTLKDNLDNIIWTVDDVEGDTAHVQSTNIVYGITIAEAAATVTPTNLSIPSSDFIGSVLPQRYGWATTATGAANYTALVAAAAVAVQCNCEIVFPGGTFSYAPSSQIVLNSNWRGSGKTKTTISVASAYSSVVFLVRAHTKLENMQITAVGLTKTAGSIGVRIANPTLALFEVYMTLEKLLISGFEKGIDYQNATLVTLIDVQVNSCTTGEFCNPDTSSGNGYVTTVLHLNCDILQNDRNINFSPTINSSEVSYIGGAIEDSTGAVSQALFGNILTLRIKGVYGEGNTGQAWINCQAVSNLEIDGATNNAGSITIANVNTVANLKNIYCAGASSVLTSSGTTNVLTIENCQFPSSGNTLGASKLAVINSTINGVSYQTWTSEINSVTGNRIDRQTVAVAGAGVTDVYRFLDTNSGVQNGTYSGVLWIVAKDNATGANQASYQYSLQTTANGATGTTFAQTNKVLRGTDPGVAANPCTLIADGGGGAAKVTFQKNAAIAQVNVTSSFYGLVV